MKKILSLLFILFAEVSFAQKTDTVAYSGIFMSCNDYKDGKLSYIINCDSESGKIKLNHFFAKSYIDVMQGNKKVQLSKDSIYGYRNCKQKNYRFFKDRDREYEIAESKYIVIYMSEVPVISSSGKSSTLVPAYYFSKQPDTDILPLTASNLEKAFPDNLKLHDRLGVEFKSSKDIAAYDDLHKMYKINYLLSQTNN